MSGPAPKPTVLRLLEGNPGKRAINKNEPMPPRGKVEPPEHFSDQEKAWFNDLVRLFETIGVMTIADKMAVEMTVEAYAEYRHLSDIIDKRGFVYDAEDTNGNQVIKRNPAVGMRSDAWRRLCVMMQQFGITPASRSKIVIDKSEQETSILDELMGKARK